MEKHLVNESKQTNTDHQSNQNSNNDSKGKQPAPLENDSKAEDKKTEVPGIGDDKEKKSDDVEMNTEEDDEEMEKDEDFPSGDPMNHNPDEKINEDSDATTITNRKENEAVNK